MPLCSARFVPAEKIKETPALEVFGSMGVAGVKQVARFAGMQNAKSNLS
jgi:hypothetical protein